MSKPDWKDAPEWAQWVARDESGRWYWYQDEPVKELYFWVEGPNGGKVQAIKEDDWTRSLERRP